MVAAEETTLALPQGADVRLISPQNPMEPVVRVYRDYPEISWCRRILKPACTRCVGGRRTGRDCRHTCVRVLAQ